MKPTAQRDQPVHPQLTKGPPVAPGLLRGSPAASSGLGWAHTCEAGAPTASASSPGPSRFPDPGPSVCAIQHFAIKRSVWGCLSHRRIQREPCLHGDR